MRVRADHPDHNLRSVEIRTARRAYRCDYFPCEPRNVWDKPESKLNIQRGDQYAHTVYGMRFCVRHFDQSDVVSAP
jgi:hypothetical protein